MNSISCLKKIAESRHIYVSSYKTKDFKNFMKYLDLCNFIFVIIFLIFGIH